ncbi:MAG TPA: hypothetical protein VIH61_08115 [Waddliaceae bacterium]
MSSKCCCISSLGCSLPDTPKLTAKSKYATVAAIVGGVAGFVIIALGIVNTFGAIGSVGYITSILGGSTLVCMTVGGIIWIALSNCKTQKNRGAPFHNVGVGQEDIQETTSQQQSEDLEPEPSPHSGTIVTTTHEHNLPTIEVITEETVDPSRNFIQRSIMGKATLLGENGEQIRVEQLVQQTEGKGYQAIRVSKDYEGQVDGMPAREWMKKNNVHF